jgi:phospholipase/carboxylesterase
MTTAGRTLARPHVWQPGDGTPLLLLHGTGGDEHDLVPLASELAPGAPLLSPRGTVLEGPMPRFFRRLREGVFDEDDLRVRADELADFVHAAEQKYDVTPGSLVAVGFSNGANMAATTLLLHPELLAGAVLIAAVPPLSDPPIVDLTGRRVLVSNGRRDPMARPDQTETLVGQLRSRGADVQLLEHDGGHQLAAEHVPAMREFLGAFR